MLLSGRLEMTIRRRDTLCFLFLCGSFSINILSSASSSLLFLSTFISVLCIVMRLSHHFCNIFYRLWELGSLWASRLHLSSSCQEYRIRDLILTGIWCRLTREVDQGPSLFILLSVGFALFCLSFILEIASVSMNLVSFFIQDWKYHFSAFPLF